MYIHAVYTCMYGRKWAYPLIRMRKLLYTMDTAVHVRMRRHPLCITAVHRWIKAWSIRLPAVGRFYSKMILIYHTQKFRGKGEGRINDYRSRFIVFFIGIKCESRWRMHSLQSGMIPAHPLSSYETHFGRLQHKLWAYIFWKFVRNASGWGLILYYKYTIS